MRRIETGEDFKAAVIASMQGDAEADEAIVAYAIERGMDPDHEGIRWIEPEAAGRTNGS